MVELFLDGKPAVLSDNVSIKLTRENVYFTKNGSYTYDVELPMQVKQNLDIFGCINRRDAESEYRELHAMLRVDNRTLLDGKAVINQITEASVKVQLLGGNSEMNFYSKGEKLYVDELDLGDWMHEMNYQPVEVAAQKGTAYYRAWLDWAEITTIRFANTPDSANAEVAEEAYQWWLKRWWSYDKANGYDDYDNRGVAFPVINTNSSWNSYCDQGLLCNEMVMRQHGSSYHPEYRISWENQEGFADGTPQVCASFQPMLCRTLRKILRALGYELDVNGLKALYTSNELFQRIFIVTANNRNDIAKALPHWTVNEFLTQVEHFLGIVIEVDEVSKKSTILSRYDWYSQNPTVISEVVDSFTAEVEKDDTNEITVGNIGYADMEDGAEHLSEDIIKVATWDKTKFATLADMQTYLNNGASEDDKGTIFVCQGHRFILATEKDSDGNVTEYYFKEVDQLGALYRKDDSFDIDVELKIVPAQTTMQKVPFVKDTKNTSNGKTIYLESKLAEVEMPVLKIDGPEDVQTTDPVLKSGNEKTDLEALISGDEEIDKSSDQDKMYVAYIPEAMTSIHTDDLKYTGSYPVVYPCSHWEVRKSAYGNKSNVGVKGYLTLNRFKGAETIGSTGFADETAIDTTVKYCFKFITHDVLKASGLFLVNNQKFACEKLEYQITDKGVSPLVTGYFYRIS